MNRSPGAGFAAARKVVLIWIGVLASLGASYRTDNFIVDAEDPEIARRIGDAAEKYRAAIARSWLGYDLPAWNEPCVLEVSESPAGKRDGSSTFYFDNGRVLSQRLHVKGALSDLVPKVLPHELTHSILANYFGRPVPRWADEGTAILSEDQTEQKRRDQQMQGILTSSRATYSLEELFGLRHYPDDHRVFYAQSYSITRYLIELADRPTFLIFLGCGMREGWDQAVRKHYPYDDVAQLERAWKQRLHLARSRAELANAAVESGDRARTQAEATRKLANGPAPAASGQSGAAGQ